jgi:hypothetical protein
MELNDEKMIPIYAGVTIVILEILFDKWRWSQGKDDKPLSTILRAFLMILSAFAISLISGFTWINTLTIFGVIFSTHFFLFDFVLNVVRWKELPKPHTYQDGTLFRKVLEKIRLFTARFFWHGDQNTKSIYDRMFQRIPPIMELMIKGVLLWITIYFNR